MKRWVWAHVVIGMLIIGHTAALSSQREQWPFSPFPMYSDVRTEWTRDAYSVYGLVDGSNEPIWLDDGPLIFPWDTHNLSESFAHLLKGDPSGQKVSAALAGFLRTYEQRRRRGAHKGPVLVELRLYKTTTPLDPHAQWAKAPQRTTLVALTHAPGARKRGVRLQDARSRGAK